MNDWERAHRTVQIYKEAYPSGTRVLLVQMSDPYHPVESGMRGTVCFVDSAVSGNGSADDAALWIRR